MSKPTEKMCLWNAFGEFACTPTAFPQNAAAALEAKQAKEGYSEAPIGYSSTMSAPAPVSKSAPKPVAPVAPVAPAEQREGFCGCSLVN